MMVHKQRWCWQADVLPNCLVNRVVGKVRLKVPGRPVRERHYGTL